MFDRLAKLKYNVVYTVCLQQHSLLWWSYDSIDIPHCYHCCCCWYVVHQKIKVLCLWLSFTHYTWDVLFCQESKEIKMWKTETKENNSLISSCTLDICHMSVLIHHIYIYIYLIVVRSILLHSATSKQNNPQNKLSSLRFLTGDEWLSVLIKSVSRAFQSKSDRL